MRYPYFPSSPCLVRFLASENADDWSRTLCLEVSKNIEQFFFILNQCRCKLSFQPELMKIILYYFFLTKIIQLLGIQSKNNPHKIHHLQGERKGKMRFTIVHGQHIVAQFTSIKGICKFLSESSKQIKIFCCYCVFISLEIYQHLHFYIE